MDKILICGPRGVGKSTLIRRLTALYPGPVSGFVTKRETVADGEGLFPIYIHPAACPEARRQYGPENLIGRCDRRRSVRCTPVFDDWGPRLLEGPGLLLMDELGFLERDARRFQEAVLAALQGDQPVLAAVKNRNDPFCRRCGASPASGCCISPGRTGRACSACWSGTFAGKPRISFTCAALRRLVYPERSYPHENSEPRSTGTEPRPTPGSATSPWRSPARTPAASGVSR